MFRMSRKMLLLISVLAVGVFVVAWTVLGLFGPMPPRKIVMATGQAGGGYAEAAAQYRSILARGGVDLVMLPTAGAVENVARLNDPRSGVNVAFVPAGITTSAESPDLASLGTMFYEPLWVFWRGAPGTTVEAWRGKRVSIGPEGSGTRALSLKLLGLVGVNTDDLELLPLSATEAGDQLLQGRIDVAIFLGPWDSPVVRRLMASPGIGLMNFPRADAHVALNPMLNKLVLPTGVGDLARNLPPADVTLLAPKTSLVVRKDMHPALQYLLLEAAAEIHARPSIFSKPGQFPAAEPIDLPLSDEARQFYKSGRPFYLRALPLPFWIAVLIERVFIVLIPLLALVPMLRGLPAIYLWNRRRKIFRLYRELRLVEAGVETRPAGVGTTELMAALDQVQHHADSMRVPSTLAPMLYILKGHIALVRDRLQA